MNMKCGVKWVKEINFISLVCHMGNAIILIIKIVFFIKEK